jgi:hypothetical protein
MNRRRLLAGVVAITLLAGGGSPASAADLHASFTEVLSRYVIAGSDGVNRVDYARWTATHADRTRLAQYIETLSKIRASALPRAAAFAFWANLYNAITLKVILDRYPVDSIRDIKSDSFLDPKAYLGPWRTKRVDVEGRSLSLDDIEHEIMRPTFEDPRVHYAVNCASMGCPNLMPRAWSALTLRADLDAAARAFINHRRGVSVVGPGKLRVSSIYVWFKEDFAAEGGVVAHLKQYAGPRLAQALRTDPEIAGHAYDWRLNKAERYPRTR